MLRILFASSILLLSFASVRADEVTLTFGNVNILVAHSQRDEHFSLAGSNFGLSYSNFIGCQPCTQPVTRGWFITTISTNSGLGTITYNGTVYHFFTGSYFIDGGSVSGSDQCLG
jgi:hypothetical protein